MIEPGYRSTFSFKVIVGILFIVRQNVVQPRHTLTEVRGKDRLFLLTGSAYPVAQREDQLHTDAATSSVKSFEVHLSPDFSADASLTTFAPPSPSVPAR